MPSKIVAHALLTHVVFVIMVISIMLLIASSAMKPGKIVIPVIVQAAQTVFLPL